MSLLQMFPSEYKKTVTIVRRSAYERTGEDITVAEDVICILQQRSDAAQRRDAVSVRSGVGIGQSEWTALLEKPNPDIAKGDFLKRSDGTELRVEGVLEEAKGIGEMQLQLKDVGVL